MMGEVTAVLAAAAALFMSREKLLGWISCVLAGIIAGIILRLLNKKLTERWRTDGQV